MALNFDGLMPQNSDDPAGAADSPAPASTPPASALAVDHSPPIFIVPQAQTEKAAEFLKLFLPEVDAVMARMAGHKIETDADEALFIDTIKAAAAIQKRVEAARKQITAGPQAFVKTMQQLEKLVTSRVAEVEKMARAVLDPHLNAKRLREIEAARRRDEEARRIREAAEAEQKRIAREAADKAEAEARAKALQEGASKAAADALAKQAADSAAAVVESVPMIHTQTPVKASTVSRGETASASLVGRWKCTRVVDISKVPVEYLVVNEVAVNKAIAAGVRQIPGLEIQKVHKTRIS